MPDNVHRVSSTANATPPGVPKSHLSGDVAYGIDGQNKADWNGRQIDIARLRQWFIKRVAQAALEELRKQP